MNLLKQFFSNKTRWIYLLFCIFLFVYLCIRGINIPLVNDEAITFFYYINSGKFLPFLSQMDANNHFLNSLLAWVFYNVLGNSEFVLRLPNILFVLVYFYVVYKLGTLIKNRFFKGSFLLIMIAAHYYFEFFALCRGYAMSMALMIASVWFLFQFFKHNKTSFLIIQLLLFALAVSANLNLIVSFITLIGVLLLYILFQKSSLVGKVKKILFVLFLGVLPVLFFTNYLFVSKQNGLLYTGGSTGLMQDTLKGVTELLLVNGNWIFINVAIALFVLLSIIFFINIFKCPFVKILQMPATLFFVLIVVNAFSSLFFNKYFGVNFTPGRAALYYFPFFTGFVFFVLDDFLKQKKYFFIGFLCLPLYVFPLTFFQKMNITTLDYWEKEQVPKSFFNTAKNTNSKANENFPISFSCPQVMKMSWNYTNFSMSENFYLISCEDYPDKNADYIIAEKENLPELYGIYDSVDYYLPSKTYLLKRKVPAKMELIFEKQSLNTAGKIKEEYFNIYAGKADTLATKSVYCKFDFSLLCEEKPFKAQLVISAQDSVGNNLKYETLNFSWLKSKRSGEAHNFVSSIQLNDLPENTSVIKIYIWNLSKATFAVSNGKCYFYAIEKD